jgi:hypothetical protein
MALGVLPADQKSGCTTKKSRRIKGQDKSAAEFFTYLTEKAGKGAELVECFFSINNSL